MSLRESRISWIDSNTVVVVRSRRAGMSESDGAGDGNRFADTRGAISMGRRVVAAAESDVVVERAAAVEDWIEVASAWVASVCCRREATSATSDVDRSVWAASVSSRVFMRRRYSECRSCWSAQRRSFSRRRELMRARMDS